MINLLPYKEKKSIEHIRTIRLLNTGIVGFIAAVIVAAALIIPTLVTINSSFSLTTKQIENLQKQNSITSDVDLASLKQRVLVANSKLATSTTVQPTEYLDIIKKLIPKGISVNQFSTSGTLGIKVSGIAENREILQSFIKILESSDKISSVDSPVSNFIKSKNSDFILTISFK